MLKKDGLDWVSKYARGGSARKVSARTFYIAIDAIQGHVASSGYAPFPCWHPIEPPGHHTYSIARIMSLGIASGANLKLLCDLNDICHWITVFSPSGYRALLCHLLSKSTARCEPPGGQRQLISPAAGDEIQRTLQILFMCSFRYPYRRGNASCAP